MNTMALSTAADSFLLREGVSVFATAAALDVNRRKEGKPNER